MGKEVAPTYVNAWTCVPGGALNTNNKNNTYCVRPLAAVAAPSARAEAVYDISFQSVLEAWGQCEKNKRTSPSCIRFRWNAPRMLVELWQQMRSGTYRPGKSACFIVEYPVKREVWAAGFRDRVVHHWESLRYEPVLERYAIEQGGDRTYNCRKGKGNLCAVDALVRAIAEYTDGYRRQDCWIVGGDFANFFMSIDKVLLWEHLRALIEQDYHGEDKAALLRLMHTTLMHRCRENYTRLSTTDKWEGLPRRKSLFFMDGLPIGNLPSQQWANQLGAEFARMALRELGHDEFVLFADDFRLLARTPEQGRRLLKEVGAWLKEHLHITLHPDKTYLQHYTKGTRFVGAVVKPGRCYVVNRTRGRMITRMMQLRRECLPAARRAPGGGDPRLWHTLEKVRSVVNSYLGLMQHYRSYKVRRKVVERYVLPDWGRWLYCCDEYRRVMVRQQYEPGRRLGRRLRRSGDYARQYLRPQY